MKPFVEHENIRHVLTMQKLKYRDRTGGQEVDSYLNKSTFLEERAVELGAVRRVDLQGRERMEKNSVIEVAETAPFQVGHVLVETVLAGREAQSQGTDNLLVHSCSYF